ncbi:hypothetical protein BCR44DRAFT_344349 [Catenaria anguillulae PL171]|uniref:PHD-type domain-containing protein n=1 Tax=Catenaria anguillulae PL171 TaxID=765915 RepID=A0A1Y2HCK6_9FUNG|nr:hypothetical protein BCR44DRAFT_344349 [Catenaria anguillulae PL171]
MSAKVQTPPPMPLPTLSSTTPNRLPRPPRPTSLASRHRAAPYHVSRPAPSPPPQKQNGVGQASSVQDSGAFQTDFQDAQSSLLPRATGNVSTEAPTGGGMANQDTVPAWLCDRCKSLQGSQVHCVFCPLRSGAMRPLSPKADVWAHVVCARYFDRGQDPVALAKSAAAFSARSATCVSHGCASGQHHHVQGGEDGRTVTVTDLSLLQQMWEPC